MNLKEPIEPSSWMMRAMCVTVDAESDGVECVFVIFKLCVCVCVCKSSYNL